MATLYGDFQGRFTATAEAYPISYTQDGDGLNGIGIFNVSPLAMEMIDLMPSYFCLGNNNRKIMELIATVLLELHQYVEELPLQFYCTTATWGLKYWEDLFDIPINENLSDEERRVAICNKIGECSSEKCFIDGLEAVISGDVIATLQDPVGRPYQLDLELRSADVVFAGPLSAPIAITGGAGVLTGDYTYKVTYDFPPLVIPNYITTNPLQGLFGETSSGISPIKVNEKQSISQNGSVTGGTFTITYNSMWDQSLPSIPFTTVDLPYDATRTQIETALYALPNLPPGTLSTVGGPMPSNPVILEFVGSEGGFPQSMLAIDSTNLTGGGFYESARTQTGGTSYGDSESNTISVTAEQVTLTNVPRSPDGAIRRNIYRKKNIGPYNEYRLVGTIEDNVTTVFNDNVPDADLSERQTVTVDGAGDTVRLRFDSVDTIDLTTPSSAAAVEVALNALSTPSYPDVEVTVTGTDLSTGLEITFNQGDVEGLDVPELVVVDVGSVGVVSTVVTDTGTRDAEGKIVVGSTLSEVNTAFTIVFQRALDYIYNTKPAHLRIRELRSMAFRASLSRTGEPV